MGNQCSMTLNSSTPMLIKFPKRWKGNQYFMSSNIGSFLSLSTFYIPCIYLKMFHVLCGATYHPKIFTSWLLWEIVFLQILRRSIGQDKKINERIASLFHLKKAMSHGFWRKNILIWHRNLYWERRRPLVMGILYDVDSL